LADLDVPCWDDINASVPTNYSCSAPSVRHRKLFPQL
jgi:hypothetical protein